MKITYMMFCIYFLNIILFSGSVFSINTKITIDENSEIKKLLNGGYTLDADGTISIYNPSNVSKIYEFNFPLELDALIGINKISIGDSSSRFEFNYDKIKGYMIGPNETIETGYHIYGMLNSNLYEKMSNQMSVLEYYVSDFNLASNAIINLQKPQQEGFEYNINGSLNSTPTGNSTRLVSAGVRNPSDYDYMIKEIRLYKTDVADPFFNDGELVKKFFNISVGPFEFKDVDFFDYESNDQSVYWVSSDVIVKSNLISTSEKKYSEQIKKSTAGSDSPSSGGGGIYIGNKDDAINSLLLKKSVDKTMVRSGEEVKVMLRVININDFELEGLLVSDEIPQGYEIKDASDRVKLKNGKIEFLIDKIEGYGTEVITYSLQNKNEYKGITYLKPASLTYKNDSIYSEGVLLINELLPEKKIFVQKEVKYIDEKFAKVTIKVKNLGAIELSDLLVSDFIDENSIMKEISQIFYEKGVWKIKSLRAGEEWEVSYLIERNEDLDKLPNVFGVEKTNIYGTLVSSEEVVTIFNEEPRTIEKVGLGLAVGLLVFYLLF